MDWILDFLEPDSGFFQQDQEWGFLSCSRIQIGFYYYWKNVTGCLLDLHLPGVKQNFWPLRKFWPVIVCQILCFSEKRNKVW